MQSLAYAEFPLVRLGMGTGLNIFVTIGIAFLTSLITSIWTPWNNLAIDRERQRRKSREEKIRRWREFIASQEFQELDLDGDDFLQHATYLELRPYLSHETRSSVEPRVHQRTYVVRADISKVEVQLMFLRRVEELEAEWDL